MTTDFRKLIEDDSIDALCVGTPDHWHAIPTILGCLAGKDVYVEKPDGHNIVEGQRMVAAMRKHKRIVHGFAAHGLGRGKGLGEAYIREGRIGIVWWLRHGRVPSRAISVGLPMARHPRRWIMICGWAQLPSDPLTQTAFMADGGGFMITVVAIWVMTVYIG